MKTVYRLFGIPVWSVTRTVTVDERETMYHEFAERFAREMNDALIAQRRTP